VASTAGGDMQMLRVWKSRSPSIMGFCLPYYENGQHV
jgi:hypothetical protein